MGLENVIKGKKDTERSVDLIKTHMRKEGVDMIGKTWICPKVLILFPEWRKNNRERTWGSVSDIVAKEREGISNHTLTTEKITYTFKASGGHERRSELEVLKLRNKDENWYAAFAENRPLSTMYRMVGAPALAFTEEDFNRQFKIYMENLRDLLDADEGCKNRYVIVHYKDSGGERFNFSAELISQMEKIREENPIPLDKTISVQVIKKKSEFGELVSDSAKMLIEKD